MDASLATASAASGVLGLLGAKALARLATRRALAQPLPVAPEHEAALISALLADPGYVPQVEAIKPEDFCTDQHRRIWEVLLRAVGSDGLPKAEALEVAGAHEVQAPPAQAGAQKLAWAALEAALDGADLSLARTLEAREVGLGPSGREERLLAAGEKVIDAGVDRNERGGAGLVVPGPQGGPPLVRAYREPSRRRTAITGATVAAAGAVSWYIVPGHGYGRLLAALALLVLVVTGAIISIVDVDTMYLDMPTFVAGSCSAWAATIGADLLAGESAWLLAGVAVTIGAGVFFEVMNYTYKRARGTTGLGFGDTMAVILTIGVPAALTGSVTIGIDSLLAGMLAAIAGAAAHKVVTVRTGEAFGAKTPFALLPYLSSGWALAMTVAAISGHGQGLA